MKHKTLGIIGALFVVTTVGAFAAGVLTLIADHGALKAKIQAEHLQYLSEQRRADSLQHRVNAQRWAMHRTSELMNNYGVYLSFCALSELADAYDLDTELTALPCNIPAESLLPDSLKGHNADPYASH